jgi:hypothetical protein
MSFENLYQEILQNICVSVKAGASPKIHFKARDRLKLLLISGINDLRLRFGSTGEVTGLSQES